MQGSVHPHFNITLEFRDPSGPEGLRLQMSGTLVLSLILFRKLCATVRLPEIVDHLIVGPRVKLVAEFELGTLNKVTRYLFILRSNLR